MRALLVCAAPAANHVGLVASQALASDLVIAVDGGARLCRQASVVPDLIVGDLDSVDADTLAGFSSDRTTLVEHPAEKDETDLDLAIREARRAGASRIAVCAAFSGRLDHTLAAIGSLASAADLCAELVDVGQQGWILSDRYRPRLDVGPLGATWSILALSEDVTVSALGVRWPLDCEPLPLLGSRGMSNIVTQAGASIEVHSGVALVMRPSLADIPASSP